MAGDGYYGCVEVGGTKFVCAVASGPDDIPARVRIPTTTPEETLARAADFFRAQPVRLAGFGIASFGPAGVDRSSPDWGRILRTPKAGWTGADIAGAFGRFGLPVGFDTDVNGAALAETRWGAAQGAAVAIYVTVGTGIGGGMVVKGAPVHGQGHPEMGHLIPPRHQDDIGFTGVCPFHGGCMEGLASGPAIAARWGAPLSDLAANHPAHAMIGWYLGQMCVTLMAIAAPNRIVLGGGVMETSGLIGHVRRAAATIGGGYFGDQADMRIVPPGLGDRSGILGALVLAEQARYRAASC